MTTQPRSLEILYIFNMIPQSGHQIEINSMQLLIILFIASALTLHSVSMYWKTFLCFCQSQTGLVSEWHISIYADRNIIFLAMQNPEACTISGKYEELLLIIFTYQTLDFRRCLCYICDYSHGSLHMYSLVGGLVPGSSRGWRAGSGWLKLLFFL